MISRVGVLRQACAAMAAVFIVGAIGAVAAQTALAQLGLTEASARELLFTEIRGPAQGRTSPIALAGTRGFLKLPPAARGPAAAGLFAWAKAYVASPAFRRAYETHRKQAIPDDAPDAMTVDQQIEMIVKEQRTAIEESRKLAATLPQADAARLLAHIKQMETDLADPARLKLMREAMEAERAASTAGQQATVSEYARLLPADPQRLFARRLREFLDATADADFSAKTIHLTGGPDGIEFVMPADREKSWIWQSAVIVGRDATMAAREAAEAWLREIER
jgi:hypothetical protein